MVHRKSCKSGRAAAVLRNVRRQGPRKTPTRRLMLEPLEVRHLLSGVKLVEVPLLDGEREDSDSRLISYLGGNLSAVDATFDYTEDSVHSGRGVYEIAIDGTLGNGSVAFVQMTLGGTGFDAPYLDTRDLTHYGEIAFWIRNATGAPLTLELGITRWL
jgi:hypothetical protein